MSNSSTPTPHSDVAVSDVLLNAPANRPLAVLHSGRLHPRWSRWSMVAQPSGVLRHQGRRTCFASLGGSCETSPRFTHDPMADLGWLDERLAAAGASPALSTDCSDPPWRGGWLGYLSYELGRSIEPRACSSRSNKRPRWPLYEWLWCPQVFVLDAGKRQWYRADLQSAEPIGDEELLASLGVAHVARPSVPGKSALEPWQNRQPRHAIEAAVRRTIEYIRAGDVFQANIAQQFGSRLNGSPRQLAAAAWDRTPNWYSAYLELAADRQVLSLSPELFLEVDRANRQITTRPLKGTLDSSQQRSALAASGKDEAELNMIVDLMRNDLGRVCEFGTVHVTQPRTIESHPTVHHGVATIEGRLRERTEFKDIIAATFPAGSITGAPKIRAMQIIDELEPFERGPYCGSIGYVGASQVALNVAIRTMTIEGDTLTYAAGAGIVAESDPATECDEMFAKSAVVQALAHPDLSGLSPQTPRSGRMLVNG